jgi:hypothetical protein
MKPDAETSGDGQDTTCGPGTASQTDTSGPQRNDDDHPSGHHYHISPEVCKSRNGPIALSDLQLDMQNGVDEEPAKQQFLQPQLLDMSTVAEVGTYIY